jgi:CRP-like cAMP-binding protein
LQIADCKLEKPEIEMGGGKEAKMVSPEWLKKTELFANLKDTQLENLLSCSSVRSFSQGETIFRQGEEANYLYVLIEGIVNLTVKAEEQVDFMTSKLDKEGAVFGIPSLIEPFCYNVTAICLKPTNILMIGANPLKKMMEEDPMMGMEVMKKLASIYFNRLNELRTGISNFFKLFKLKKM